ncbi:LysR family transcriptional regulator [Oceaniglobus indicus]|uniref:LysR family transcriptional regulator n=1 Tax=Oceaniglobus indicus TaxID=2047749 RepID=UPI000C17CBDB|nr:LysR family transcriptional regulator [Oceaniglobus indicus]
MTPDLLRRGLKLSHLRLMAALLTQSNLGAAARSIAISQPAASRLAAELERILGVAIYTRTQRGVVLTPEGAAMARRAARMLHEIELGGREVDELRQGAAGRVRLGSVTGPAVEAVLSAVTAYRAAYPRVDVGIDVGPSDRMVADLLDGTLDFAIARRPGSVAPALLSEVPIADEPVVFAVRSGHPLVGRRNLELADLMPFDWVVPSEGAILRTTLDSVLRAQGLGLPERVLSTSSFVMTLAATARSDAIAPIAAAVCRAFPGIGLEPLDLRLKIAVETFSYLERRDTDLTPAARMLSDMVLDGFARRI